MSQALSRRSLAKGAAWAAPAVLATTAIPAYAASRCDQSLTGSATYSGTAVSGSAQGKRIPITSGGTEVNAYTINIASGSAVTQPSNQTTVRNGTFTTGAWAGETGGVGARQIDANKAKRAVSYAVNGLGQVGTELKRGLVLTQLRYPANNPSSQTVTYTFEQPVYSFSMPIYDLTYIIGQRDTRSYQAYRDVLQFSVPVTMTGGNAAKLNNTGGTEFYLTEMVGSSLAGASTDLVATYTSSTPITSFSVTYTDNLTDYVGWQGIAYGPISTACPPAGDTSGSISSN